MARNLLQFDRVIKSNNKIEAYILYVIVWKSFFQYFIFIVFYTSTQSSVDGSVGDKTKWSLHQR